MTVHFPAPIDGDASHFNKNATASMAELAYWARKLLGVSIASIFVATSSFFLRFYVQRWLTRNFDSSDLHMTFGLLAGYGFTACSHWQV